jgi:hypothetical protein
MRSLLLQTIHPDRSRHLTASGKTIIEWEDSLPTDRTDIAVAVMESPVTRQQMNRARALRAATIADPIPLLWLIPENRDSLQAYEVADVVLASETDGAAILGQIEALTRHRETYARLAERARQGHAGFERMQRILQTQQADAQFAEVVVAELNRLPISLPGMRVKLINKGCGSPGLVCAQMRRNTQVCLLLLEISGVTPTTAALVQAWSLAMLPSLLEGEPSLGSALREWSTRIKALPLPESAILGGLLAVVLPITSEIEYASAGLPGPILVPRGRSARHLPGLGSYLTADPVQPVVQRFALPEGERLILLAGPAFSLLTPEIRRKAEDVSAQDFEEFARQLHGVLPEEDTGLLLVVEADSRSTVDTLAHSLGAGAES